MKTVVKTVVIWDSVDADVKFFVTDRDLTHLNHKYVNSCEIPDAESDEICNLVYDSTTGEQITEMQDEFPVEAVKAGAAVIVCGFLP